MTEPSMATKVAWGSVWSIVLNVALKSLGIISIIILAPLITPYDLGVYVAAAVVVELVHTLTNVGIFPILIHKKDPSVVFYQTAWTIQLIRCFIIFIIIQLFAEYFFYFYSDDEAVREVIQVVSISILIGGFSSIYLVNFEKNIDFKTVLKFRLICRVIGFFATIAAAYILQSYWALVIGNIVGALTTLLFSYFFAPGAHRITLHSSREFLNVSRWLLTHEISTFISLKSDTFLITRFLGPQPLGVYEVGYQVAMAPTQEIALPISRALFPGLAKLQDDKSKFAEMMTFTLIVILYIALPVSTGLFIIAEPLITSLFPENWHNAIIVVQLISIFGFFRVFFGPCVSALMGAGHMKLTAKLSLFNMFMRTGALTYGIITFDLMGLLIASSIIAAIQSAVYLTVLAKKEMLHFSQLIRDLWRACFSVILMIVILEVLFSYLNFMQSSSSILVLLAYIVVGCLVYVISLICLWRQFGKPTDIEGIIYTRLSKYLS